MAGSGILVVWLVAMMFAGPTETDTMPLTGLLYDAVTILPALLMLRYPFAAWRWAYVHAWVAPLLVGRGTLLPTLSEQTLVLLLVMGAAALRGPRRMLWAMGSLCLPMLWVWCDGPTDALAVTALFVVVLAGADMARARAVARRELVVAQELTEVEKARSAVLEERARIARELHDVVAHHMSLIAVRAETAPYRLPELGEPEREEFTAVAGAARESMGEMRRLLTVLRGEDPAQRAPQPGLPDVASLVEESRAAGARVAYSAPEAAVVPATVGLGAYRIVQESLSNARRHAPGAPVKVDVEMRDDALRVRIVNEAPQDGRSAPDGQGVGHGLQGMAERATALGGTFAASATESGGYRVAASLPLFERARP
ncbi:sensor histidine kinase [Streptomyces sp. NPDC049879]|uniref:sensor histidine kinase n=1 Tax=Streptomyces sp. NPDC049879 TaxID=3365598 RepID=UPI003795AE66